MLALFDVVLTQGPVLRAHYSVTTAILCVVLLINSHPQLGRDYKNHSRSLFGSGPISGDDFYDIF